MTAPWDVILGAAGLVLSILALGVSVWAILTARRADEQSLDAQVEANRLSAYGLQPFLTFDYSVTLQGASEGLGVRLENRGLGPAIVDLMECRLDGREWRNYTRTVADEVGRDLGLAGTRISGDFAEPHEPLAPGSEKQILWLRAEHADGPSCKLVEDAMRRVEFRVHYHSTSGEAMEPAVFTPLRWGNRAEV